MTLEHLTYILEINKYKSINKAAKCLFISQPSLSIILKNIEAEIGYKIFERTSSGIEPTEQGEVFLQSAEKMYNEYSRMRSAQSLANEDDNIEISASASSMFSNTFFKYKGLNPAPYNTQDIYREDVLDQNFQDIITHKCRVGLTYISKSEVELIQQYAQKNDLELFLLMENLPIKIVVSKSHELAKQPYVDYNELSKYKFVTYDKLDFQTNLGSAGIDTRMDIQYISSRAAYYDAIRFAGYIGFTFDFALGEAERLDCVCIPLINQNDSYVVMYFIQKGYKPNKREQGYLDYLKKTLKKHY